MTYKKLFLLLSITLLFSACTGTVQPVGTFRDTSTLISSVMYAAVGLHLGLLYIGHSQSRPAYIFLAIIPAIYIALAIAEWLVWFYVFFVAIYAILIVAFGKPRGGAL